MPRRLRNTPRPPSLQLRKKEIALKETIKQKVNENLVLGGRAIGGVVVGRVRACRDWLGARPADG